MATPRIVPGSLYQTRSHRVDMDVTNQFEQISVSIDQYRLTSALKQMSPARLLVVDPARVAERQVLHDPRQGIFGDLYEQMNVVGHATKTMNPMAVAFHPLLKQQIQVIPIVVDEENILPTISAQHDMIVSTGYM